MLEARQMGSAFEVEGLVPVGFAERLAAFLESARQRLGLSAILVAELGAAEGRIAPAVRAVAPRELAVPPLSLAAFRALASGSASSEELQAARAALHGSFASSELVCLGLAVAPRIAQGTDALLLLVPAVDAPSREVLAELRDSLERGLSHDRRSRMAEILYTAVEAAPDAIEMTDKEAHLIYANPAWERSFRYSLPDVVGSTVGQLFRDPVAPLHDPAFYQFTLATLHAGRPWLGALACRAGDGERVFCEVHVSPFSADAQGVRGNLAVRRDIAHRAERDAALALVHREFRAVLSAIPDGVAVLRDGRIYFANQAFLATVRLSEEDVIGKDYSEFVHPDDRSQFELEHQQRVTRVRLVSNSGPPRFVEISTAGAVSFEGRAAMILLSRDTTDYRLAQEQLARAERLSALGVLAASVAHEINNPLAYVILNLELVQTEPHSTLLAAQREALDEAIDGVRRIRQIVAELRGFSGSDGPGPAEPVDVQKAVTSALNIVQNEIRHRARLERDHEPGLFVLAREGQLVQVLVNVLANAAQAIPASSGQEHLISVRTLRSASDQVLIAISDTGCGIAESSLAHVFEPFFTGKRRGKGSGLGLPISKRIIDAFGGQIRMESQPGRGTRVFIELPAVKTTPLGVIASIAPSSIVQQRARRARVLVVDDERPLARTLRRVLSTHEVVLAYDGTAAYDILQLDRSFDVVLCDLMMPGLSGVELYQRVSALHPELESRFIFMTGGSLSELGDAFLECVGPRVLTKPFDHSRMLEWVNEAVRRTSEVREESR